MSCRFIMPLCLVIGSSLSTTAIHAQSLGAAAPPPFVKEVGEPYSPPAAIRQGGDTIATATVIPSIPYTDTGTTVGYTHDYTATCFSNATAPDVVYRLVAQDGVLFISLCGSTYDTGLIIYDAAMRQIACNDDACDLQSLLECCVVDVGATYYIVVTGYSSASGDYTLTVSLPPPGCYLECPATPDVHEGEPPLQENYVDTFNGGCNTSPTYPFQHIPGALMPGSTIPAGSNVWCGRGGWYASHGSSYRDTDWYTLTVGPTGSIGIVADAVCETAIYELSGECTNVWVAQQAIAGPCAEASMTISGSPGATKWFWVASTHFEPPPCFGDREYDYVIWFDGLMPEVISAEAATWGDVKALYR